jgi:hypothetical protein
MLASLLLLLHFLLREEILPAVGVLRPGIAEFSRAAARRHEPQRAQRLDQAEANMLADPDRRHVFRRRPIVQRAPIVERLATVVKDAAGGGD